MIPACDALLEDGFPPNRFTPLHPSDARPAMVYLAMQASDSGAWGRLVEMKDGEPGEALRYAIGMTDQEMGDLFREWALSVRPEVHAGLGSGSLFAGLWILAFSAFAMRSSRWRLG